MQANLALENFALMPYWSRAAVGVRVLATGKSVAAHELSACRLRHRAQKCSVVCQIPLADLRTAQVQYFAPKDVPMIKTVEIAAECVTGWK